MSEGLVIFVGGGQDYHGHTSERDRTVVSIVGRLLAQLFPNLQLVCGGTPGIPMDVIQGALEVNPQIKTLAYVSHKFEPEFLAKNRLGMPHVIVGETQEERRLALPTIPGLKVGLFISGGQYTAHEIKIFQEHKIPVVAFWGSGGASGGKISYGDYMFSDVPENPLICSEDPMENPEQIAKAVVEEVKRRFI
jgi:hypothetical protein